METQSDKIKDTLQKIHSNRRIAIAIAAFATLAVFLTAIMLQSMENRAQKNAETQVELQVNQYYMVSIDGKPAFYFTRFNADSTFIGVAFNKDSLRFIPQYQTGRFYHAIPTLPTCMGRIKTPLPKVTTNPHNINWQSNASRITDKEISVLDTVLKREDFNLDELTYYMRVHSVIDEGFSIVANYKSRLDSAYRRHKRLRKLLNDSKNSRITITLENEFTAIYTTDSGTTKREKCRLLKVKDSTVHLRLASHRTPSYVRLYLLPWETPRKMVLRLPTNGFGETTDTLGRRIYGHFEADTLRYGIRLDSAGLYAGELNRYGVANGHGSFFGYDGTYYEGNWLNNERQDWGFALNPGRNMRAGEWKADVFQGERLTYTSNRIYGIDISKYQHERGRKRFTIDWNNLHITHLGSQSRKRIKGKVNYPVRFVFIKSTEGTTVRNAYFHADYRNARSHGLHVGAYHFFSLRTRGSDQARYFLKNSLFQKGDLPPVLDVEPSRKQIAACGGVDVMWTNIRAWLRVVEQRTGCRPILYISQGFVNRYLPLAPDVMKNYTVWIARYGEYKPNVRLAIWQLCPDGRVSGIHGYVDVNVFNGYNDEFAQFLKSGIK
ncbi:MAG: GH25 family lysozyme [Prevotella sp.]|jgi:lysozyme